VDAGRILRQARRRAGLTQRALAERAGVPQPTVARIERGTTVPRVDTLDKLLEQCGEGLYARARLGIGVDRTLFPHLRALEPSQRIITQEESARDFHRLRAAYRAQRGWVAEQSPAYRGSILAVLARHRVRFVLIGGVAANVHGSATVTNDIDICYARDRENVGALVAALRDMEAGLRGVPEGLPFILDEKTILNGVNFTFTTVYGPFDCLGEPSGVRGFDELFHNAIEVDLDGWPVAVAALQDLIRMKLAAGRPKDLLMVEELGALQEEIDRRDDPNERFR